MKKIVFAFFFLFSFTFATGQIKKNGFLLGLDFGYSTATQKFYDSANARQGGLVKSVNFSLTPTIGYFISNRLLIGVNTTVSIVNNNDSFHGYIGISPKTVDESLTAYVRHYSQAGDKVWFFLQAELTWGNQTLTTMIPGPPAGAGVPYSEHTHFFRSGIRPGVVYFLTPRLGIEAIVGFLGYTRAYAPNDLFSFQKKNITETFGVSVNSSNVNFGFKFYLAKREPKS